MWGISRSRRPLARCAVRTALNLPCCEPCLRRDRMPQSPVANARRAAPVGCLRACGADRQTAKLRNAGLCQNQRGRAERARRRDRQEPVERPRADRARARRGRAGGGLSRAESRELHVARPVPRPNAARPGARVAGQDRRGEPARWRRWCWWACRCARPSASTTSRRWCRAAGCSAGAQELPAQLPRVRGAPLVSPGHGGRRRREPCGVLGSDVPFGTDFLFVADGVGRLRGGRRDLRGPVGAVAAARRRLVSAGATVICNLSASNFWSARPSCASCSARRRPIAASAPISTWPPDPPSRPRTWPSMRTRSCTRTAR